MAYKKPKGLSFFRDLGGIECADGRRVASGLLFRSGHLGRLNSSSAARLKTDFHIAHVADLRSNSEVSENPDVIAADVAYHRFPPLDDSQNPSVNRNNRLGILRRLMAEDGGTLGHLCSTYREMVSAPASLDAFRKLLGLLLDGPGGAILSHCTQGKDRTGLGSAIILLALGADRDAILRDYLRYNRLCRLKNALIFIGVAISRLNLKMARSLDNLMSARAAYLNSAFDEIDERYGGTDGFLRDALGFSDESLLRMRSMYLA